MRIMIYALFWTVVLLLSACDSAKEEGQETVKQLSGGGMIEQEKQMQQKLDQVQQQQQERYQQLDQQLDQQ